MRKEKEAPNLAVRGEEVDDLDARLENLLLHAHLGKLGRLGVDRAALLAVDRATLVNGLANDVHDAAERLLADGDGDRVTRVAHGLAAHETLRAAHNRR
jgi:hypothetical protein